MLLQKLFQPIFGVSLIKLFHLLFATLKLKYYITEETGGQRAAFSLNPSFNLKESLVCPVKSPKELFINYVSCFRIRSKFLKNSAVILKNSDQRMHGRFILKEMKFDHETYQKDFLCKLGMEPCHHQNY